MDTLPKTLYGIFLKVSSLVVQEYDFDAPVRILEKMMHSLADPEDQQVVVLGHVLAAEINIGYEEIVNTQAGLGHTHLIPLHELIEMC